MMKITTLRVDLDTHAKISAAAKAKGLSINEYLSQMCRVDKDHFFNQTIFDLLKKIDKIQTDIDVINTRLK